MPRLTSRSRRWPNVSGIHLPKYHEPGYKAEPPKMATVIVAALLPFTTCLFQESYLGCNWGNLHKEFPWRPIWCCIVKYTIPPLLPGSKIATAVDLPFRVFFLDTIRGTYNHGPLLSIHWKKNSPYRGIQHRKSGSVEPRPDGRADTD